MSIITLTTDFGTRDGFVGAIKGVIARLGGDVLVVDLAHDIPRHDIAHGAWVVATACREFPTGTVHLVVVDPGVGGARKDVIVRAHDMYFVGPDNGLFGLLAVEQAWAITNPAMTAPMVSPTFHGRDVFAPVAATLARGRHPDTIGPRIELAAQPPWGPRGSGEGRVIHIDHYGNLITDLPADEAGAAIAIAGRQLPIARTYEDVGEGELLAYIGSARTIEIAVRNGRADRALAATRGIAVTPVASVEPYR